MARAELSMYMDRAPDEVFAFVSDPANNPRWRSYVVESGWLDDGPMRLGRRGYQTSRILGQEPDDGRPAARPEAVAFGDLKQSVELAVAEHRSVATSTAGPDPRGVRSFSTTTAGP